MALTPSDIGMNFTNNHQAPELEPKTVIGSYSVVFAQFQHYLDELHTGSTSDIDRLAQILTSTKFESLESMYKDKLDGAYFHGFRHALELVIQRLTDLQIEHKES